MNTHSYYLNHRRAENYLTAECTPIRNIDPISKFCLLQAYRRSIGLRRVRFLYIVTAALKK